MVLDWENFNKKVNYNYKMPKEVIEKLNETLKKLKKEDSKLHYDLLKKISSDKKLIEKIISTEEDLFNKINYLYHYGYLTDQDKEEVIEIISKLSKKLKSNSLKEIKFFVTQLENWIEHEKEYLNYIPGASRKEYVKLIDLMRSKDRILIINKAKLMYKSGRLFYNDKEIQGINIKEKLLGTIVEITGEHYTDMQTIKNEIYRDKKIVSSTSRIINIGDDPYCYLAEPGKLGNQSINNIRRILGAASAEGCITVKIINRLRNVWIRVKKDYPAKFAIEAKNLPIIAPKKNKGFRVREFDKISFWAA